MQKKNKKQAAGSKPGIHSIFIKSVFVNMIQMDKESIKNRIKHLAEIFEMGDYIDRQAGKLSKWMRQKAAFARAIVHGFS